MTMAPPTAQAKRQLPSTEINNMMSSSQILQAHKRRRPTDRSLPATLLSHDQGLMKLHTEYERLLEVERTLDSTYTRKKAELLEEGMSLKRTTHKNLRVRISNECAYQAWQQEGSDAQSGSGSGEDPSSSAPSVAAQQPDFDSGKGVPSWTVKIEGKLVDVGGVRRYTLFTPLM